MGYPTADQVQAGVDYGATNELTGTYNPMASAVFPPDNTVLWVGGDYGPSGMEYHGSLIPVFPDSAKVVYGGSYGTTSYGLTGTEYTAALDIYSIMTEQYGLGVGLGRTLQETDDQDAVSIYADKILIGTNILGVDGTAALTTSKAFPFSTF